MWVPEFLALLLVSASALWLQMTQTGQVIKTNFYWGLLIEKSAGRLASDVAGSSGSDNIILSSLLVSFCPDSFCVGFTPSRGTVITTSRGSTLTFQRPGHFQRKRALPSKSRPEVTEFSHTGVTWVTCSSLRQTLWPGEWKTLIGQAWVMCLSLDPKGGWVHQNHHHWLVS